MIMSGEPLTGPRFEPDLNTNQITATTHLTMAVCLKYNLITSRMVKYFCIRIVNFYQLRGSR